MQITHYPLIDLKFLATNTTNTFPPVNRNSSVSIALTFGAKPNLSDSHLLAIAVTTVALLTFSPDTLSHRFSKSHASSGEPCLDRSSGHSEEICCFANAQAIDVAQLEGCAQSRR